MLHKIFLFVNNNQYSLDVTPYPTAGEAVSAAMQVLGSYDEASDFVTEKLGELQEKVPQWSNQQWQAYWQSLVQEARALGLLPEEDQLDISQKEIEISQEPQPCYGFGHVQTCRVGAVDIASEEISQEAAEIIKSRAWTCKDPGEEQWNFYGLHEDGDFWDSLEDEPVSESIAEELGRLRAFLSHNDLWWVRIISW